MNYPLKPTFTKALFQVIIILKFYAKVITIQKNSGIIID
jgi:hypothetical protein